jgi:hypothetical protein
MKNLLLTLLVLLLFTNMQCSKTPPPEPPTTQPDGLPLETQEGKNTFGCFWNDTLWLPVFQPLAGPELDAVYDKTFKYARVIASQRNIHSTISIGFSNDIIGEYNLDSTCNIVSKSNYEYNGFNKSVKLKLTKFIKPNLSNNGIVSGNVSGVFYRIYRFGTGVKDSFDLNDSIIITKGVFDVKLR